MNILWSFNDGTKRADEQLSYAKQHKPLYPASNPRLLEEGGLSWAPWDAYGYFRLNTTQKTKMDVLLSSGLASGICRTPSDAG